MKRFLTSFTVLMTTSFFLCGLQSNLYFLPLPLPYFWFVLFTYYNFKKNLMACLTINIGHACLIASFSSLPVSHLLFVLNAMSLVMVSVRDNFQTSRAHMMFASGIGSLCFMLFLWFFNCFQKGYYWPPLMLWGATAFVTFSVSPFLIGFIEKIDQRIYLDRVDTLQNLRV